MKNSSRSPCNVCSIRYRSRNGRRYSYSVRVHPTNASLSRGRMSSLLLRKKSLTSSPENCLDTNSGGIDRVKELCIWHLTKFIYSLVQVRKHVPLSKRGYAFANVHFDTYSTNSVVTDHLLTDVEKYIFGTFYRQIKKMKIVRFQTYDFQIKWKNLE